MVVTGPIANSGSSGSGTNRVSDEKCLSQAIRSNSGRFDGYKFPIRGNLKLVSCSTYPASVLVSCALDSHTSSGDSHSDFKATPGSLVIKIHSKPRSLSADESKAMTRGTGIEVFFLTNWSVATSLAVLKYGSTGRLTRIMKDSRVRLASPCGCNRNSLLKAPAEKD